MATSKYEKEFRKKYGITSATTEANNENKADLPDWAKKVSYSLPTVKRGYAKLPTVRPERNGRIELPKDTENGRYYEVPEKKETFAEKVKKISLPRLKGAATPTTYGQREQTDLSMPYATSQNKKVEGTLNLTQGQQTVKDMPRNLLAGIVSAANVLGKVTGTTGRTFNTDRETIDVFGNMTDEEYQKRKSDVESRNTNTLKSRSIKEKAVENLQSKVTEKTPLYAKMVRGALLSTPTSALTSAMGGGLASVVSGAVANPMVVELARDTPMFANSYDDGLKEAEKMNLKGVDRQVYAVGQGLIETITERMSSYGLEAQLLGLGTATGKGLVEGSKEFMKSIIEEGGSEGIATIAGQLLKGEYGSSQSLEADLEEIMVAIGTGGIMGGAGTVGSLSGGVTYETIGTDGDKVIVQTSDGRIEPVTPEVLVRYQLNESKRAYLTKNQTQEIAKEIIPEVKANDTMPTQEPAINQDELQPNNEVSTPKELKPIAEPLNEVVEEDVDSYYNQPNDLDFTNPEESESNEKSARKSIQKALAKNSTFEVKRDGVVKYTVHESNKENGKYQMTYYDKNGEPLSDSQLNAKELIDEVISNKIRPSEMVAPTIETTQPSTDGTYTYQYKLRGFSPGAQPNGVISNNETDGKYGSITYDRPLTEKEISDYELVPKTEQVVGEVPETSELDKLKSWVANVEKNEIQKSSKQNKAKYDKVVEKIKALDPTFKVEPEIKTETVEPKKAKLPKPKKKLTEIEGKNAKAQAMRESAEKRKTIQGDRLVEVEGGFTPIELKNEINRRQSNYSGKEVTTPDGVGTVQHMAFGEVRVEVNGKVKNYMPNQLIATNPDEVKGAIPSVKEKLVSNNMEVEKDPVVVVTKTITENRVITSNRKIDNFDEYEVSQAKTTLSNTDALSPEQKALSITPNPMLYKKIKNEVARREGMNAVQTDYMKVYNSIQNKFDDNTIFAPNEVAMVDAFNIRMSELYKATGDSSYMELSDKVLNKYWEMRSKMGQSFQALSMITHMTPEGLLYYVQKQIDKTVRPKDEVVKKIETELDEVMPDIPKEKEKEKEEKTTPELPKAEPKRTPEDLKKILDILGKYKVKKQWLKQVERGFMDGSLTKQDIIDQFYEEMNVPHLSQQDKARVEELLNELDGYEEGTREHAINLNEIATIMYQNEGGSLWRKINAYRVISMLGNLKTTVRNEGGNFGGLVFQQWDDRFSFVFDRMFAKVTGELTTVKGGNLKHYAYLTGLKQSLQDFVQDVDSRTKSDKILSSGRTFKKGSPLGQAERLVKLLLDDRRHFVANMSAFERKLDVTEKYAKEHGLEFDKAGIKEALEEAVVKEYTFNNNGELAQTLTTAIRSINKFSTGGRSSDFGLGTAIAQFTKTNMNIAQFIGSHTPGLGFTFEAMNMYENRKLPKLEKAQLQQRTISRSLGKQVTGSMLIGVGALLSAGGFITNGEDDEKVKALLEAQGLKGSYINISAIQRALGGIIGYRNPSKPLTAVDGSFHNGDSLLSISWATPIAPFLLLGSRLQQARTDGEANGLLSDIVGASGESVTDFFNMPFSRFTQTLNNPYLDPTQKAAKLVADFMMGFVPQVVKQSAQATSPYTKEFSKDFTESLKQQLMGNVPGLRKLVPNKINVKGEEMPYYENDKMGSLIWNAFVNPSYTAKVDVDSDTQSMISGYKKGTVELPVMMKKLIELDSKDYPLTREQQVDFQKIYYGLYKQSKDRSKALLEAKKSMIKKYNLKPQK